MIKTKLNDLTGIKYPIFQGAMAWISDARLAAAVSNAGGLGIIASGNAPAEWVRDQIQQCKKLTDKPFGVNVLMLSPHAAEIADLVAEERVAVVTTGAGSPSAHIKKWKDAGIVVIPVIASTGMARMMERAGADAVIAEGSEAGGHIGDLTTMALVPQVVSAVNIPVIAAGGIADGRGIAAALMLGAVGVQLGTRFLAAHECHIHQNYKNRVIAAKDIDTIATGKRLGHPVRCLKTPLSRNMAKLEYDPTATNEELEKMGVGALRLAAIEGDEEQGCFMAGQVSGMITREQSATEIIEEIFIEAEDILKSATKHIT
jgi:enoyl-[acyl-carrier protein] reductase II